MIDVAHDGNHGGTAFFVLLNVHLLNLASLFFVADLVGGSSKIAGQLLSQLDVKGLVDGRENLLLDQLLDD